MGRNSSGEIATLMVDFPGGNRLKRTKGFLARPKGVGKTPAVIVIHEFWGLVDHIKDIARRFANEGYAALAVDLFDGKSASKPEEAMKIRQEFSEEKILGDLKGAIAYLKTLDFINPKRISSIGFCMGGWLSLSLACHTKELAGAVVFYGRIPAQIDLVRNLSCPILGNYGGADLGITDADINRLKDALIKYGKKFDIKVYPGAPHAFFNDTRESYRPDAAKDAWNRTLTFFRETLQKQG
jgi:carboxymethylenebutenolidase